MPAGEDLFLVLSTAPSPVPPISPLFADDVCACVLKSRLRTSKIWRHVRWSGVRALKAAVVSLALLFVAVGCGMNDADKVTNSAREKTPEPPADDRPNIVFVVTDDMEEEMLREMPVVQRRLVHEGVRFDNAFVSNSLCCPSRATMLRGQYSHNHHVQSNSMPDGGAVRFRQLGRDRSTFATWLQDSGYRTALVGKYLNNTQEDYIPPGWDEWYAMTGSASDHTLDENGQVNDYPNVRQMTDVYQAKAMGFLRHATDETSDPPFMLWLGTWAPHLPAKFASRHADLYKNAKLRTPPSFNERDLSDKPRWLREVPRLTEEEIRALQTENRDRLRSLRDVDEMVGTIMNLLRDKKELGNTYVVFTTDNGLQRGEHRLLKKSTPYEEAAGVPLVIRGPGVPAGVARDQLVINNDFAPTFADWAGVDIPAFVDGRSLAPLLTADPLASSAWRAAILNERHQKKPSHIPEYEAVRTGTHTFVQWETGERELYDLQRDPYQLDNVYKTADPTLIGRLKTRLKLLEDCAGTTCRAAEGP
jgi:N-acetylglucosamine-6-sulfatase